MTSDITHLKAFFDFPQCTHSVLMYSMGSMGFPTLQLQTEGHLRAESGKERDPGSGISSQRVPFFRRAELSCCWDQTIYEIRQRLPAVAIERRELERELTRREERRRGGGSRRPRRPRGGSRLSPGSQSLAVHAVSPCESLSASLRAWRKEPGFALGVSETLCYRHAICRNLPQSAISPHEQRSEAQAGSSHRLACGMQHSQAFPGCAKTCLSGLVRSGPPFLGPCSGRRRAETGTVKTPPSRYAGRGTASLGTSLRVPCTPHQKTRRKSSRAERRHEVIRLARVIQVRADFRFRPLQTHTAARRLGGSEARPAPAP